MVPILRWNTTSVLLSEKKSFDNFGLFELKIHQDNLRFSGCFYGWPPQPQSAGHKKMGVCLLFVAPSQFVHTFDNEVKREELPVVCVP